MASKSSSDLIQLRMKLVGNRLVVTGTDGVTKSVKGLGKATTETSAKQRHARGATSRLTSSYREMAGAAKFGLGFLGAGGVFALKSAVDASEDLALATSGLTRNFGFNTNVASRWAAVMHGRSVEPKALTMAFATLSTKMTEAGRKGGTLLTPFHQLGITQDEVTHGAKNFEWGLLRVAKALGEEEGGARRSTAAKALLGKGFQTLTPLFSEGAKGLKEQLHWADKYGVTLSTTTKDGLMDSVVAQRESKVAMLGLQLALTNAFLPAIDAGHDELQKFIATLNSPHLTAEQKISRISHQFLSLEDDVVHLIEKALPHIAEEGGRLGVALAGAIWHGFIHSDTLGRLVIGAWLFKSLGGLSLVGTLGARVGGKLASSLGWKFLATVAPYFAAEAGVEGLGSALGSQMGGLKALFSSKGRILGLAMGAAAATALAAEVAFAVTHREELFGLDLVFTPELDATSIEEASMKYRDRGYTEIGYINGREFQATTPSGKHVIVSQQGKKWVEHPAPAGSHGGRRSHGRQRPQPRADRRTTQTLEMAPPSTQHEGRRGSHRGHRGGGGRLGFVTIQIPVDGKVLAEKTVDIAELEASLK